MGVMENEGKVKGTLSSTGAIRRPTLAAGTVRWQRGGRVTVEGQLVTTEAVPYARKPRREKEVHWTRVPKRVG